MAKELGLVVGLQLERLQQDVRAATGEFRKFSGDVKKEMGSMKSSIDVTAFASVATAAMEAAEQLMAMAQAVRELAREYASLSKLGANMGIDQVSLAAASALAGMYGVDPEQVATAANALAKNFGISFSEALGQLNVLGQLTPDLGEGIEQVKEYSTQFKTAGYSAAEFVEILRGASSRGVWSDKAPDAIKEGLLSIREQTTATTAAIEGLGLSSKQMYADIASGLKSPKQALQEIAQRMLELPPQSQAVGTALADIWRGAGEDLGVENFDLLLGKHQELSEQQQKNLELSRQSLEVNTAWEQLMLSMLGGMETGWRQMGDALKVIVLQALPGIQETLGSMGSLWEALGSGLWETAKILTGIVVPAVRVLWNLVSFTANAISGVVAAASSVLAFDFELAGKQLKTAWAAMTQDSQDIIDTLMGVPAAAKKAGDAVQAAAAPVRPKPGPTPTKAAAGVVVPASYLLDMQEVSEEFADGFDLSQFDFGQKVEPWKAQVEQVAKDMAASIYDSWEALGDMDVFDVQAAKAQFAYDNAMNFSASIQGLTSNFSALFSSMQEGEVSLAGAMDMLAQTAMTLIGVLQALSAAKIIESESWKGAIGMVTAGAAIVSMLAMFAKFATPKKREAVPFADGGLVYGPTHALVGEYQNARRDPEVIAPLSKLRAILEGTQAGRQVVVVETDLQLGFAALEGAGRKMERRRSS